jgi:hypothetical protein
MERDSSQQQSHTDLFWLAKEKAGQKTPPLNPKSGLLQFLMLNGYTKSVKAYFYKNTEINPVQKRIYVA